MSGFTGSTDPGSGDQAVLLDDFVFNMWEVPEKVNWGGDHRMMVHKFVGGTRWIDMMGPDDADISWSARFLSPDAASRADELDQMRREGKQRELVFAGRYYKVVISKFSANQEMLSHVPYSITLTPVSDNSAVAGAAVTPMSSVTDDVGLALLFLPPLPIFGPDFILAAIVMALLAPFAIIQALNAVIHTQLFQMHSLNNQSDDVKKLLSQINQASAQIQAAQTAGDNQIEQNKAQQIEASNVAGAQSVQEATINMQTMLAGCYASATAAALGGYIDRAKINASSSQ